MFSVRGADQAVDEKTYVEDVFSAFTYTGDGVTGRSLNMGFDFTDGISTLSWFKARNKVENNILVDTVRGLNFLIANATDAQSSSVARSNITSFTNTGVTFGTQTEVNGSGFNYIGWTFRKAPKFFDIVTYTGNGVAGRQIAHSLGIAPGMIVVKQLDGAAAWMVQHRSLGAVQTGNLNTTGIFAPQSNSWNNTDPTDTVFTIGNSTTVNTPGGTYVAYLFAHDTSADGIIQCGTYAGNGGSLPVNLGWEPQYVLIKAASSAANWHVFDTSRGFNLGTDAGLFPNLSQAESAGVDYLDPASDGFVSKRAEINTSGQTYVYLAIRKGLMRPPTDASKVFDIVARTGTGSAATITTPGIKTGVDLAIVKQRNATQSHIWQDRLRGTASQLTSDSTAAETISTVRITGFGMDNVVLGANALVNTNGAPYINYFFKQARGFLDIVGYTGTGVARTVPHNLGAVPELMIVKPRVVASWNVFYGDNTKTLILNTTAAAAAAGANIWNFTNPTDTSFSVGTALATSAENVIAYLFASCPGVSKIGTYTGTGAAQNIDCGFTAGARFVMIKRIDNTGDWYYWDSTRGIISGNDPYLLLNSTAAEVTSTDYLDPLSAGFTIDATAPAAINASGGTFLYWSVA